MLAGAAFASFAGSFVTTPVTARGDAGTIAGSPVHPAPSPTATAFAVVLPRRDPFAGDPPLRRNDGAAAAMASRSANVSALSPCATWSSTASHATIPTGLVPLPPNEGASGTPLEVARAGAPTASPPQPNGTVRVTAVVTGTHPYALVDDGLTARLVTIGDRIGEDTVAAITADGIRLAHGATVPLAAGAPPIRPPSGGHQL